MNKQIPFGEHNGNLNIKNKRICNKGFLHTYKNDLTEVGKEVSSELEKFVIYIGLGAHFL